MTRALGEALPAACGLLVLLMLGVGVSEWRGWKRLRGLFLGAWMTGAFVVLVLVVASALDAFGGGI